MEKQKIKNEKQNFDILETIEIENHKKNDTNIFLEEKLKKSEILAKIENILSGKIQKKQKTYKKVFGFFVFLLKYILVSSFIFVLLLGITNYSAYIEIAKSYFNPDILKENKEAMMASVMDSKIKEKDNEKISKNSSEEINKINFENKTEEIGMVENKTYHSMEKLISGNKNDFNLNIEITPYENRIVIPKISKNIPLVEVTNKAVEDIEELEDIFLKELTNGIVRYPGSAKPGEIGNSFIFGHSSNFPWLEGKYNDVFALLDNVVYGDEIIAYYGQKKYIYKVKEKKIIRPGNVSVLKRNNDIAEITLMTCWPIGTTLNRMIVIGELIED